MMLSMNARESPPPTINITRLDISDTAPSYIRRNLIKNPRWQNKSDGKTAAKTKAYTTNTHTQTRHKSQRSNFSLSLSPDLIELSLSLSHFSRHTYSFPRSRRVALRAQSSAALYILWGSRNSVARVRDLGNHRRMHPSYPPT